MFGFHDKSEHSRGLTVDIAPRSVDNRWRRREETSDCINVQQESLSIAKVSVSMHV